MALHPLEDPNSAESRATDAQMDAGRAADAQGKADWNSRVGALKGEEERGGGVATQERPEASGTASNLYKGGGTVPPAGLKAAESAAGGDGDGGKGSRVSDVLGKGYSHKPEMSKESAKGIGRVFNMGSDLFKNVSGARKKLLIASATGSIIVGLAGGMLGLFNILNIFQMDHLLSNIERKGFLRYQINTENRSSKWVSAYMVLRMAEVEDKELNPKDRDNIIFRSNRVDMNNPLVDWYKTMRASKFEEDLWLNQGIKFASIAYKDGNIIKFRPAVVTALDKEVKFEPTDAEIRAIENGDINGMNNRLREFVDVQILSGDKEGRKVVKQILRENTKSHQFIKRYYLRKSIQNMTGIRDWRFFEKTKAAWDEKKISIRNSIIQKSFPESTKSGKFIQCMFGLVECKTTTDPGNPANRSALAPVSGGCSNDEGGCSTGKTDEDGNPVQNGGTAGEGLSDGVGDNDPSKSLTKKMLSKVMSKLNVATGIVDFIDTLNTIDGNLRSGSLTAMVYMAKATQAIGVFTTVGIIRDQMKSGEVNAEQVNETMEVFSNAGNSEGWQQLIVKPEAAEASAAQAFETADNRAEYCDNEHQEQMLLPENMKAAAKEFAFLCPAEKIGGANMAKSIEDGWNNSIGVILTPILAIYNGSGLSTVVGWFNSAVEAVLGPLIQGAVDGILSAVGLKDNFEDLMGWLMMKAASVLGAGPTLSENSPPGVWTNHALMGAAASSEFAQRSMGGARTTEETAAYQKQQTIAYNQEEQAGKTLNDRYFSLRNHDSLAAKSLFALVDKPLSQTVASAASNILTLPATITSGKASAATTETGYEAAQFAGVETYDIPQVCMDLEPIDSIIAPVGMSTAEKERHLAAAQTNADELGILEQDDLSWSLMTNHDAWYDRLYQDDPDPDTVAKVYNCQLLESAARGGFAKYDNSLLGPNAYGAGFTTDDGQAPTGDGTVPSGTTQELAQQILASPNIKFQIEPQQRNFMDYIAKTGKATACGAPGVDSSLLGVILALSQKFKLTIGVLVDGHGCGDGYHDRGVAVDINGVNPLTGNPVTGDMIEWSAAEQPILKDFYNTAGPLLTSVGGGGLGQSNCWSAGDKPTRAAKVAYFSDTCHHIHLHVTN